MGPNPQSLKDLLPRQKIDEVYHEPYILGGYRRPGTSLYHCLQYALVLHNDVGNFWTHFIPFWTWLTWLLVLAKTTVDFSDPYHYPLLCFWTGACTYALCSSLAHLFGCVSYEVRTVCFMLDYLGIAMYALGGDLAAFFYLQPAHSPLFDYTSTIVMLLVLFAISSTLFCSLSRFYWREHRFVIRIVAFGLPYISCISPYLYRVYTCWYSGTDCVPETRIFHVAAVIITFFIVFFFVTKIPERLSPGRFDVFFQSHQLFHVSTACLTSIQMYFLPIESTLRRGALSSVEGSVATWQSTFLPFLCAGVVGVMLVALLGYLTKLEVLSRKKK